MVGIGVSIAVSLAAIWLLLVIGLVVAKPEAGALREAARIVPDAVRLIRRLAADKTLRPGVRVRLWLLLAYLLSPIDLIPDFIPVIGLADDAIIMSLTLRSVIKHAGVEAVTAHWPGTPEGLATLFRVCRLPSQ